MIELYSEAKMLRNTGGFGFLTDLGVIEIAGSDAATFLQARTSNDIFALEAGCGQRSSMLSRKGHVLAYFSLHKLDDKFWLIAEKIQIPAILEQFTTYHFNEKLAYHDKSAAYAIWTVQGPKAEELILSRLELKLKFPLNELSINVVNLWGCPVILVKRTFTGEAGCLFFIDQNLASSVSGKLKEICAALQMVALDQKLLNIARIEAGMPLYGLDITSDYLLPETGLEHVAASYTKGCFLGQEVLARIKAFGAPRRGLVGFIFAEGTTDTFPINTPCLLEGHEIALLKSNVYSPLFGRTIAMAYVAKEHRIPNQEMMLNVEGKTYNVKVVFLPFYLANSAKEKAQRLYDAGLAEFAQGSSEEKAIELLRKAIEIDPLFGDAYESLGVILARKGELEEAIVLMKKLESLDPQSIMAHTNLSVFYMQQGDKELAEEEKAKAMSISMSKMVQELTSQKKKEEEQQAKRQDAYERTTMFRQVLEIDSQDLFANYGLGSIYVELEQYQEAIPYLEKALAIKPTHTVAYLALAKAYEHTNSLDKAIETYKKGIIVAGQRGDIAPMKEMQMYLSCLDTAS